AIDWTAFPSCRPPSCHTPTRRRTTSFRRRTAGLTSRPVYSSVARSAPHYRARAEFPFRVAECAELIAEHDSARPADQPTVGALRAGNSAVGAARQLAGCVGSAGHVAVRLTLDVATRAALAT